MSKTITRFYKAVAVAELESGGFAVQLDGRPVRTPGRKPLALPGRPLADAIAAEWQAQGENIDPASMPIMSMACTAIDQVGEHREAIVADIAAYGGHELLCYREDQQQELAERQKEVWQPLLDWVAVTFDAPLKVTSGILPVDQPEEPLAALERAVDQLDDLRLAVLGVATKAAGSLVVGLALVHGRVGAEEAFEASQLDETFQIEKWGEDAEAAKRRQVLRGDLEAAVAFLSFLRD